MASVNTHLSFTHFTPTNYWLGSMGSPAIVYRLRSLKKFANRSSEKSKSTVK